MSYAELISDTNANINIIDVLPYKIIIGAGTISSLSDELSALSLSPDNIFVVADKNALRYHGDTLRCELERSAVPYYIYEFDASEASKSLRCAEAILTAFCERGLSRRSVAIGFGGGVTGDITGFCASVYMRGIRYISIPTTLIACADSSIGGKTAVNTGFGKNLIGTFYNPSLVVSDTGFLSTLNKNELSSGMAEAIKCSIIGGGASLNIIADACRDMNGDALCRVINVCAELKASIVSRDPYDLCDRRLLNFGHTIGHAVEHIENTCGGGITHGAAVGIGMVAAARLGAVIGKCGDNVTSQITDLLTLCSLPTKTNIPANEITQVMMKDKKQSCGYFDFIVPNGDGCEVVRLETSFIRGNLDMIL